jgi:short coiled-coil protein
MAFVSDSDPIIAEPSTFTPPSRYSSTSSSTSSDTKNDCHRPSRLESIIVLRDHSEIEIEKKEFPPDDARAMSPRRNSEDLERLGKEARKALKE